MSQVEKKADGTEGLTDAVKRELDAHLQQYLKDPENAHMWDPIVIGVPGGPVPCLLLTLTGRKSGRTLHSVLQYYKVGDEIIIVASRGGTEEHPTWYLNLLAHPECTMQIGKSVTPVTARTIDLKDRAPYWDAVTKEQPIQLEYQARTSRIIPLIVLEPRAAGKST
jgi:deazaflavin-dependent oxidoreductase (nitroreductase family)